MLDGFFAAGWKFCDIAGARRRRLGKMASGRFIQLSIHFNPIMRMINGNVRCANSGGAVYGVLGRCTFANLSFTRQLLTAANVEGRSRAKLDRSEEAVVNFDFFDDMYSNPKPSLFQKLT